MKFTIGSSCYNNDELLEKYPCLSEYNFEILEKTVNTRTAIRDENGKRMYQCGTKTKYIPCVNVDTLEQLVDLSSKVGQGNGLIIFPSATVYDGKKNDWVGIGIPYMEIYDGYRE